MIFKAGNKINNKIMDRYESTVNKINDDSSYIDMKNKVETGIFNSNFEKYAGTKNATSVGKLLDEIVINNKKNSDKIITVVYNENTTTESSEIVKIKHSFKDDKEYEVMFDYNKNGLINKVDIEDIN